MKFRYLSIALCFILLVHFSTEQGISYSDTSNNENSESTPSPNPNGLAGTIRNTTSNILQRLEGPRDRVLEFIKPAVKSDFSRNVTEVLNSVWNRVHSTNSSIIHNPLFRNSIVIPINTTLARLKEITAAEDEHSELDESKLEIINLNRPEDENRLREFLKPDANAEEVSNSVPVIFLVREEEEKDNNTVGKENDENTRSIATDNLAQASENEQSAPILSNPDSSRNDELNDSNNENIHDEVVNNDSNPSVDPVAVESPAQPVHDQALNPTKSKRSARFMDNHHNYMTPERANNLFDSVQRHRMQECMALALCEANCRPESYEQTRHGLFRRLFDRIGTIGSSHSDYDYYSRARDHGRRYYGSEDCRNCHYMYNCPHDRESLIDRFYRMESNL